MKKTFLLITLSLLTIGLQARTWTVRTSGGDFSTIREAVDTLKNKSLADGDVVDVLGDFTADTVLVVAKSITILGGGTNNTSITRVSVAPYNNTKRLFQSAVVGKTLIFKNLTLKQAVYSGTDVGMGVYSTGATSTLTVDNVVFNGFNSGSASAGALWASNVGTCSITNCEFINNTTTSTGGAISIQGSSAGTGINKTIIDRCTFEGNNASSANSGHAIVLNNVQATASLDSILINNCTFYNNGATANVGTTIRLQYNGARIGIKNCTFANNNYLSTAGDIFTNSATNTIASKLALIGNLFYKGSLIINGSTAASGTYTQWTGWSYYNFATGSLSAGTYMTKAGNAGSLTADASGGLQVEYNPGTGKAILTNNGGIVRTIKLLGTSNAENKAINAIPLTYKQNTIDARAYTRKTDTSDAGAYELDGLATVITPTMSNETICYYDNSNQKLHFLKEISGDLSIVNLNGRIIRKIELTNATDCNIDNLKNGIYLITIQSKDAPITNKICIF